VAQEALGQDVRCPACCSYFPTRSVSAPSLLSRSVPAEPAPTVPLAPPNRTVLAEPEAMIRYSCPRCNRSLESPVSFAGQKLNCPDCNQRLQIPKPSAAPAGPSLNKTMLAPEELRPPVPTPVASARSQPTAPPAAPPTVPPMRVELIEETPAPASRQAPVGRESCLECGADISQRQRVQTCPDCGSLFCSAMCIREHRRHAHSTQPKGRPQLVECSRCGSSARPYQVNEISSGGWVVFAVLLILFFPLCWIGLLMTESHWKCSDCGARIY
jgi:DNA-directed RNA polymerase subunit RPC12/RpoP